MVRGALLGGIGVVPLRSPIRRLTHPVSRGNWETLPPIRRTSPSPTTAPAGAGCKTNVSAALPVPPPSTRTSPSISSAMPSSPLHTSNTPHFLPTALSTRSLCSTRRYFPTLSNADICWSAPTTTDPPPPPKPPLAPPASTPPHPISRSGSNTCSAPVAHASPHRIAPL